MKYESLDMVAALMLNELRLSKYDEQFINDLFVYMSRNNAITSNQDKLFKRIALNYERQFSNKKVNIHELIHKPWLCPIIPSLPEYTNTSVFIKENQIIVRSPYNKNFISAVRKKPMYTLEWAKERRQYEMIYSLSNLKSILSLCFDHFEDVILSPEVIDIVDRLSAYDTAKYWDPTLVLHGNKLMIGACTDYLYDAVKDIPVELTLKNVATFVSYGIDVSDEVKEYFYKHEKREKVDFACAFATTFEDSLLPFMFGWLKEFGCDTLGEYNVFATAKPEWKNGYVAHLEKLGMEHIPMNKLDTADKAITVITSRSNAGVVTSKPLKIFKLVKCVNSQPINLGPR